MAYTAMKEVEGLLEKLEAHENLIRELQAEIAELKAAKASKSEKAKA